LEAGSGIHSAGWGGHLEMAASSALLLQGLKQPRAPQGQICSHRLPIRPSPWFSSCSDLGMGINKKMMTSLARKFHLYLRHLVEFYSPIISHKWLTGAATPETWPKPQ